MPVVSNGAELVKRLKASGTPDQRLEPARACLRKVKAERGETANSAQVIEALEAAYGPNHMTVVKAKAIARTGEYTRSVAPKMVAIEDELLGGVVSKQAEKPKPEDVDAATGAPAADAPPPPLPPVSSATVAPPPSPPPPKPKTQKATQTREINSVKSVKPHDTGDGA
jgi:hypothetical protein